MVFYKYSMDADFEFSMTSPFIDRAMPVFVEFVVFNKSATTGAIKYFIVILRIKVIF
jgi:hypothetical protein